MPTGTNPHKAAVPDYSIVRFEATQLPLINAFNVTHKEAAECLTDISRAQNQLDRQEWDRVLTEEAQAQWDALKQQRLNSEDLLHTEQEEQENAKREDQKKNCSKFVPFPDTPIPSTTLVIPSPLAACKLCKGKFCELYFFTNKGLAEAEALSHLIDDEALSIVQDKNSVKTWIGLLAKTPETRSSVGHATWPQLMCCALVAVQVPEVGRGRVRVLEQGGSSDNGQDSEQWGGNKLKASRTRGICPKQAGGCRTQWGDKEWV